MISIVEEIRVDGQDLRVESAHSQERVVPRSPRPVVSRIRRFQERFSRDLPLVHVFRRSRRQEVEEGEVASRIMERNVSMAFRMEPVRAITRSFPVSSMSVSGVVTLLMQQDSDCVMRRHSSVEEEVEEEVEGHTVVMASSSLQVLMAVSGRLMMRNVISDEGIMPPLPVVRAVRSMPSQPIQERILSQICGSRSQNSQMSDSDIHG